MLPPLVGHGEINVHADLAVLEELDEPGHGVGAEFFGEYAPSPEHTVGIRSEMDRGSNFLCEARLLIDLGWAC